MGTDITATGQRENVILLCPLTRNDRQRTGNYSDYQCLFLLVKCSFSFAHVIKEYNNTPFSAFHFYQQQNKKAGLNCDHLAVGDGHCLSSSTKLITWFTSTYAQNERDYKQVWLPLVR